MSVSGAKTAWIEHLDVSSVQIDGLVRVAGYLPDGRPPEEVVTMEKAASYGAYAVFFEAGKQGRPGAPQAFLFVDDGPANNPAFAELHKRIWSWGGVPLLYRRIPGLVQLFRCAHKADFISASGDLVCKPVKTLGLASRIVAKEAWWDAERLRNSTLWDDPAACKLLLSASKSAHRRLVDAVSGLHSRLKSSGLLNAGLRRRLLILSLLIAYLEERGVLPADFFGQFTEGATRFFHVLEDGPALVQLLRSLEMRFNGHIFRIHDEDRAALENSTELQGFSTLIEARVEAGGQLNLWALYSFRDLPVEVISHIYQLLNAGLRRRLLILSLLIAYLEERGVLPADFFGQFTEGATRFFHVLEDGPALVQLLRSLEMRFNGHIFRIHDEDRAALENSTELQGFSTLIEARVEAGGQLNLWALYSFRDLPVEVISHIYQLFVSDTDSSVYTPPSLVRLMLDEALSWQRLDRVIDRDELILDPACGSGIFLVEAYKRLVLHWRSRNGWAKPGVHVLRALVERLRGVDVEGGAIELAAFSLCLALCDALEPEDIRASVQLFPKLNDRTLIESCFFEAKEKKRIVGPIGVVVGNPPFVSALKTQGAIRSYQRFTEAIGTGADKQIAYLFLHEAMELLVPGGTLSMLQQYNLIYNASSAPVRTAFFSRWDVREILDFVSIRGLFSKGGADTKIVAVVADAAEPPNNRRILHAVFRRAGRADAEQGFDIDYYDLHWLPRSDVLAEPGPEIWRSGLLGGARAYSLVKRLKQYRTLKQHAAERGWHVREGFVEGQKGVSRPSDHLIGKPLLPSTALSVTGIDKSQITVVPDKPIEGPRSAELFTPPMLLVREHEDLPNAIWSEEYLTFKNQIVGFAKAGRDDLEVVARWLKTESIALRAYAAGISTKLCPRPLFP